MTRQQADEKARLIWWTPAFPKKNRKAPWWIRTSAEAEREITVLQCLVFPENAWELTILQGVVFYRNLHKTG